MVEPWSTCWPPAGVWLTTVPCGSVEAFSPHDRAEPLRAQRGAASSSSWPATSGHRAPAPDRCSTTSVTVESAVHRPPGARIGADHDAISTFAELSRWTPVASRPPVPGASRRVSASPTTSGHLHRAGPVRDEDRDGRSVVDLLRRRSAPGRARCPAAPDRRGGFTSTCSPARSISVRALSSVWPTTPGTFTLSGGAAAGTRSRRQHARQPGGQPTQRRRRRRAPAAPRIRGRRRRSPRPRPAEAPSSRRRSPGGRTEAPGRAVGAVEAASGANTAVLSVSTAAVEPASTASRSRMNDSASG